MIERIGDSRFGNRIAELESENKKLRENASPQPSVDQEREAVYNYLDRVNQGWRDQNNDPAFIQWLGQVDPMLGKPRQEALNEASIANDAIRISQIFSAYRPPHPAPSAGASPQGGEPTGVSLEGLVAPGTSNTGAAPVSTQETVMVWTQDEVAKFYSDVRRGRYNSNPQDRQRIEQEITAAAREGRITGDSSLAPPGAQPQ